MANPVSCRDLQQKWQALQRQFDGLIDCAEPQQRDQALEDFWMMALRPILRHKIIPAIRKMDPTYIGNLGPVITAAEIRNWMQNPESRCLLKQVTTIDLNQCMLKTVPLEINSLLPNLELIALEDVLI